ncbi:hypothetical protein IW140_003433 [Coemansia sp. RSA 1813]|nr:hypothetical protein EV178_003251 [Coemansia sp. RSA 1646]KAJ1767871.1 hypothetical protein LPJ74_005118 [Coemansia sp. RSA 1843]KAJ2089297.1 hypothetical protein IW138_003617 [Coemansia sp. RSA 986]KAJ2215126.1 hypothetical protein EV179_002494 [Coemansia sp. RSA 487]KAJ2569068.1 hypothetical protein IW140_003433 [Coemansia sp. RSA 1813]
MADPQDLLPLPSVQALKSQSAKGLVDFDQQQTDPDINIDPARCFPVRIRSVAGRGRGYFAARDIAKGETVFMAVPLAYTINEDWVKNICWWCFTYNPRKTHPVGAVDNRAPIGLAGHPQKSSVPYKGVFCSTECKQKAVLAHGGQIRWHSYVALLSAIDGEVRAFKGRQNRPAPKQRPDYTTKQQLSNRVHCLAAPDTSLSTFADAPTVLDDNICAAAVVSWDIDFDPDDLSDEQLRDWISRVWDIIIARKLFRQHIPDSSQRELARLIANAMCLEDATTTDAVPQNWQVLVLSLEGAECDFAPPSTLSHVRNNEVDYLRSKLRKLHSEPLDYDVPSPQTPATIVPIRLPHQPTADQIEQSQWGTAVFKAVTSAYMLLAQAWRCTAKTHTLGKLTHERFRAVYYREMANSFGIWENAGDDVALLQYVSDSATEQHAQPKGAESEWLGFLIYSTAVYFNHSCAPNVRKIRKQRTMHFISCRDIAQDEELFITYGSVIEPGTERRNRLQEHFFFECTCDRCLAEASQCLDLVPNDSKVGKE